MQIHQAKNVLGGPLVACSYDPVTGFYRTGCCETGPDDLGRHLICVKVTEEFLAFSLASGNDLTTPRPEYRFAGVRPGYRWCLCALRWREALDAGVAPPVVLAATHEAALRIVDLATLRAHALDQRA
ncbi:MAG: DUF2237 domain-containing protein [Rhodocyclaceae bacterium]|nr:DUF2237 domain-containing protein [Rhodocyclaceae bacterium]